ncbi:hypothetical protein B0H14DRAFT_1389611 [Mycena olivaceomarginata]|nr:hypothetical protein B0H14DRAFT_1389611 [Mycena olivaceomarginata]
MPRARHHAGTNTDQTALPATRAARDAGLPRRPRHLVALPQTVALQQCTAVAACACRTPQHHLHHLLPRAMVVPHRRRRFIASSRAKCVSSKIPDPHARRALACTTPRVRSTCSSRSPSPAPRFSPPCPPLPCPAPHYPPLQASSCPAPGVRRAASPERATSATRVSRRPHRLHRPSVRRDHPLRPRRPPLQTSACRASRTRRAPPPACHSAAVPHRPVASPPSTSILSGMVPRSLPTPPHRGPCAARRAAASHRQRQRRLCLPR